MNWQSMFKENQNHSHYLGFVKKVFDDMIRKSKLIQINDNDSESFV
jgi:hypothetical protein